MKKGDTAHFCFSGPSSRRLTRSWCGTADPMAPRSPDARFGRGLITKFTLLAPMVPLLLMMTFAHTVHAEPAAASTCEIATSTQCNCSLCELHGSEFLRGKCCAFQGVPASLLAFEEDSLLYPRLAEFNGCTGARVTHSYVADGEDGMQAALEADVGTYYTTHGGASVSTEGGGIHDAYIVQAPWIPTVVDGLENLSPRISSTPAIDWCATCGAPSSHLAPHPLPYSAPPPPPILPQVRRQPHCARSRPV